ncbi:conserved exported hypothetical protein [Candidatus Nitrotoga sp. BS]|uniref:hypothetical protein n=1 Tax=Candidatus Nitrotoga sp. BS TaxID=2890408 RepID=UPI001EF352A3|nr:hypothetical protein [Candidatus Nitrotoga sp. BS]CAH1190229.1 conserved exported hypothetical protein [Candidatus Nitrotoga sp. BS]
MRTLNLLAISLFLGCYVPVVLAADASVTISSPTDGAKISSKSKIKVSYEVTPGQNGDHVHLYIDEKEAVVLRKLKGTHTVESLDPGKHAICIKIVNKGHTPIGVQACTNVDVV